MVHLRHTTTHHFRFSFILSAASLATTISSFLLCAGRGGRLLGLRRVLSPVHAVRPSSARRAWWKEKEGEKKKDGYRECGTGKGEGNQGRREGQEPHVEWMEPFLEWKRATATARRGAAGGQGGSGGLLFVVLSFLPHGAFPSFCRLHSTFFRYPHTRHTQHIISAVATAHERHGLYLAYAWFVWVGDVRWVWRVCRPMVACGGDGTRSCFFEGGGGKGTRCLPFCDGILLFRENAQGGHVRLVEGKAVHCIN